MAMMTVSETVVDVLSPVVGKPAAEICLRSCSGALGKPAEELDLIDMPFVAEMIRDKLHPLASSARLNLAIDTIKARLIS